MKIGMRKPSLKKSFKARTTGKAKRAVKKALIPGYGKKGSGWIKNPKKAAYNKVYNATTFSVNDAIRSSSGTTRRKSTSSRPSSSRKNSAGKRQSDSSLFKILKIFLIVCVAIALSLFLWIPAIVVMIKNMLQDPSKRRSMKNIAIVTIIGLASFIFFIIAIASNSGSKKPQIGSYQPDKTIETEIVTETESDIETETDSEKETVAVQLLTETETSAPQKQTEIIQQTETKPSAPTTYYATASVNVRSGPGTEHEVLGTLNKTDRIEVQSVMGEWAEVSYNDSIAYVSAEYLSEKMPQTERSEELVWLPQDGHKYHSRQSCSGMNSIRQVTIAEAESLGYEACKKCH